jgi:hypothetical protein
MVKVKDIIFREAKNLPTIQVLGDKYGIAYNTAIQRFEKKLNNSKLLSDKEIYPLAEFISDYYEMDFTEFKEKLKKRLGCTLNEKGYLIGLDNEQLLPIRNLAYFASKENKFDKELGGRERGKWIKTIYKDIGITTSQANIIADFINQTINNESLNSNDVIMLKYLKKIDKQTFSIYKVFKSVDVKEKKSLIRIINLYADGFFGQNNDYSEDIDRLEIDIINALQGGCNKRELKSNDPIKRIIHPKSSYNNCFFKCIQPYVPELGEKILKSECNRIRKLFDIKDNEPVDVRTALNIFSRYRNKGKDGIEIWANDVLVGEIKCKDSTLKLLLQDNHYSMIEIKKYQQCGDCGRKFINKHTCNTNMIVYKNIKEGKNRCVVNGFKRDKVNYDKQNEDTVIIHYDIETHTRQGQENMKIHTPYIIGFVDSICNKFQYFTGTYCMEKFILHLFTYHEKSKVYINAFNGSKFDHYEFVKKLNKMYNENPQMIKLKELVLNNGAILKASVGNIDCFDISKHITGTLRQNLLELGCSVQKGDFDYSLGDDWEKMTDDDQSLCLQYLKGDVMGLKELSEKLNHSCFQSFGVNLYKYLSTSQLTYAVWVNFLYKESKNPIFLQTPEQEKFFRESIYGGRTYKYKNKFVSQQREEYISGNLTFEEIDDYLIDADVNSLYPAAMKNLFPTGTPRHLKPNFPSVTYYNKLILEGEKCPVGIFRIEYVTNKNLIDGILPRREDGRLIWDLKDHTGIYNSVDIDNALELGYKIKLVEGYYWEKTENVFDNYINYLYDFKKNANKGSAQYTLAKLMMNGLYGKTIQRPILDENVIIRLHEEFIKLHIKFGGVAMRALSDGSFYLTYQDKDKLASKITKPCYLGSFILGYSRKIMLDYLQKSNPYFNSDQFDQQIANAPYYTDTDSIQIHKRNLNGLSLNNEIGGISDDLGENCKILYGGWIAPKLYFLEYAEKTNDSEEVKYHLRGKGIPKDQLTIEMFESMMTGKSINIEMQRNFKRIHVNRNSKQKDIDNFSILQLDALGKQINTVPWRGRHFIGNSSVPLHHNSIN